MGKVTKYWSINPTDPDVWHDESTCGPGGQIPSHNRREGNSPPYNAKCKDCIRISG